MPRPNDFVRNSTLVKWLEGLLSQINGGKGWRQSELDDSQWLTQGPRYWFAGQIRRVSGQAETVPFWVKSTGDFSAPVTVVSGSVLCPLPGVICLVVSHEVEWTAVGSLLEQKVTLKSVRLASGLNPPAISVAKVEWQVVEGVARILSQQSDSTSVEILATIDISGRVSHVASTSTLGLYNSAIGRAIKVGPVLTEVILKEPEEE
jgi:hypothetical protein